MVYFELAENHLAVASLKRDAARVAQCAEIIAEGPAIDSRASSPSPRNGRFGCRHFQLRPFFVRGQIRTVLNGLTSAGGQTPQRRGSGSMVAFGPNRRMAT
jgi:hypothetical protein